MPRARMGIAVSSIGACNIVYLNVSQVPPTSMQYFPQVQLGDTVMCAGIAGARAQECGAHAYSSRMHMAGESVDMRLAGSKPDLSHPPISRLVPPFDIKSASSLTIYCDRRMPRESYHIQHIHHR